MNLAIFLKKYPNDEACLEHIKRVLYPQGIGCYKCRKVTNFTKIKGRPVYQCGCGYQISPLAGTIFEKSTTKLQYWFYAIFTICATRSGISAKQLQRELGVSYKCAWRMMRQIRMLMSQPTNTKLNGTVEIDESFFRGDPKNTKFRAEPPVEQIVMGMVERNGKAYLKHIPNTHSYTLLGEIKKHVDSKARVMTDQFNIYTGYLTKIGYTHSYVNHSRRYVVADIHTQNIESMWSNIKRGIYGVYRHVSPDYLQSYLDEYNWRFNHRKTPQTMFDMLIDEVASVKVVK